MADAQRAVHLTLGEWAVLGLVATRPRHAFAIVKSLAPRGEFGRIWSVPTPVVYRAVNSLREAGLIVTVGEERSDAGPPRTLLKITPRGRNRLDIWLHTPVKHMRDVRSELLLKLALLARLGKSAQPLVEAQLELFEPVMAGLEQHAASANLVDFESTLARWRLESARAAMVFLKDLARPASR